MFSTGKKLKPDVILPWQGHKLYLNTKPRSAREIVTMEITAIEIGDETLTLPKQYREWPITTCHFHILKHADWLHCLYIASSYIELDLHNDTFPYLETFVVHQDNRTYMSQDNMLFSSRGKTLERILGHYRDTSFTVPKGVKKLADYALEGALCTEIYMPEVSYGPHTFDRSPLIDQQRPIAMAGDCFYRLTQPLDFLELPPDTRTCNPYCFSRHTPEEICAPLCFQAHTSAGIRSFTLTNPHAEIYPELFHSWYDLQYIEVPSDHDSCLSIDGVVFSKDGTLLCYPRGRTQSQYEVPAFATAIAPGAFRDCAQLQSVSLGVSITEIGEHAFRDCVCLTEVWIHSETQLHIGQSAFDGCRALSKVHFPEKLALTLDERAFARNFRLEDIDLPEGLTHIGPYCFSGCACISFTLPASVQVVDEMAFSNAQLGRLVVAPRTQALQIGDRAFCYCTRLCIVRLPPQFPLTLGDGVFSHCERLTDLQLPYGTTHIGADCLDGTDIQTLTLPRTVQTLASRCLQGIPTVSVWEHSAKGLISALFDLDLLEGWDENQDENVDENVVEDWEVEREDLEAASKTLQILSDGDETGYSVHLSDLMAARDLSRLWDDEQLQIDAYMGCLKSLSHPYLRQMISLSYILQYRQNPAVPEQLVSSCRQYLRRCSFSFAKRLLTEGRTEDFHVMLQEDLVSETSARKLLEQSGNTVVSAYLLEYLESRRKKHGTLPL